MSIEMPKLFKISEIFEKRIFRIPMYQRGYSWTEKQLNDFWSDLSNIENNQLHFTGTITVQEPKESEIRNYWRPEFLDYKLFQNEAGWFLKTDSEEFKLLYIIDGQQRLTTILILIEVLFAEFNLQMQL